MMRAISHQIPQQSIIKIRFKISYLKFHLNLPEADELISDKFENSKPIFFFIYEMLSNNSSITTLGKKS